MLCYYYAYAIWSTQRYQIKAAHLYTLDTVQCAAWVGLYFYYFV